MIKEIRSQEDIAQALTLVEEFLQETVYKNIYSGGTNEMHIGKLIHAVSLGHHGWLALVNDEPVGLLLAVKEPNIWAPHLTQMRELIWYVKPEHRSSTIGGRLFKEYQKTADLLLNEGKIRGYFTTRMTTTDQVNLERRGFKLVEQTYLKEQ